jgi:Flp pilus assembly protein TadG
MRIMRTKKGQCFIEMIVGSMVLIPVCLVGLDFVALVLANSMNDSLAKSAARAAANQQTKPAAQAAALQVVSAFPISTMINDIKLTSPIDYNGKDKVAVNTTMTVRLPAPFPGFNQFDFRAQAVEPIVGKRADI